MGQNTPMAWESLQELEGRVLLSGDAFGVSTLWYHPRPAIPTLTVDMTRYDRIGAIRSTSADTPVVSPQAVPDFAAFSNHLPVLSISDAVADEGSGNNDRILTFNLTLSETAVNDVVVNYQTVSGTALDIIDYDALGAVDTVVIPAGQDSGTISVRTVGDNVLETDEFFTLELTNARNAEFAGGGTRLVGTGTILDDDTGGNRLALFVEDAQVIEGDSGSQNAVFRVHLSRDPAQSITVDYTTSDGSAQAGQDYQLVSGQFTFSAGGSLVREVSVPVLGDTVLVVSSLTWR